MRMIVTLAFIVVIAVALVISAVNVAPHTDDNITTRGFGYRTVEISVYIKYFVCDQSLDPILNNPDPYFVVFVNDQEIKSPVWDGTYDFAPNWWANFTLTVRDNFVWIEIASWDDDSLLTGRDDLIDIDPGPGFALDLVYDLNTHTWSGDVDGNCAFGNNLTDWGDIWFEIYSTPDLENSESIPISLPYSGCGRVDDSAIYLGSTYKDSFADSYDNYSFYLSTAQNVSVYLQPEDTLDAALYLYDQSGTLIASSDANGSGGIETLSVSNIPSGYYILQVYDVSGYGFYHLAINTAARYFLNASLLNITTNHASVLNVGKTDITVRMMGFDVYVNLTNPMNRSGIVRINVVNLDPDYVITNCENCTHRGNYSLYIVLPLNASDTRSVHIYPWYVPSGDFWVFVLGDNRPGCGIYDDPYTPSPEYTLFTYYQTNVIRAPFGVDNGDLVAGFGGALVTEYDSVLQSALDYVYDTEYNRFYMLTGLSDTFYFTTVGNHDVSRHDYQPQHAGERIYETYLGALYYSFNYSNTHFVFPDPYQDGYWANGTPWWYAAGSARYGGYIYGKQLTWLENDLRAANASGIPNKIVILHMPLHTPPNKNDTRDDSFINYTNRLQVMNIFKEYGVNYLIVAHLHNYTFYYTDLYYNTTTDKYNLTATYYPAGNFSIPTLLTGGAGAHNNYEWIVPDIEGSYHFVLLHINGTNITYRVYKYENLTDANGNPLTYVSYAGPNNGTLTDEVGVIKNGALYSFPYIRMKFYMSNEYTNYIAYSNTTNTYETVHQHRFSNYTVVYVDSWVAAYQTKYVEVYPNPVPEISPTLVPLLILLAMLSAILVRKRD